MSFRTAFTAFTATATPATPATAVAPPAISGRVERATFRTSIPSLSAGNRQDVAQRAASRDVRLYRAARAARAARVIGSR